ncbi:probable serine incorporator [Chenopodium quinoa]|uniref:probable serine incorporator n=1 Tax=Chenopodium quinoa TaxID=63459 RepID=UPI000B77B9C2|nr:probable serine incorporator [Chenopodium quinoa]XP_021725178.1 probable serine incorporator [Chenopodium quinoa]
MTGENTGIRVSEAVYLQELSRNQQKKTVDISVERSKSLRVRYYYGVIFLITNFVAWIIRDYIQRVIPEDHFLRTCGIGGHDCIQTIGVLRISFGCFIFFAVMFLTTVKTSKLQEVRNAWHSGWWPVKCILLVISMMSPFFVPSEFIHFYGEFARIGAGIFLALQLISVIQFIAWWNNYWMPDVKLKQSCSLGLFMSTLFYVASICGVVALYILYVPRPSCTLNIFFITWTAVLLIVMMLISLHSKVNRGLLSSGIMAAYVVFLCWSAIRSEPAGDKCSPQKQADGHHDWMTVFSFFIGICAIVMATFSTGIDSESFQFRKVEVQEEDDIPYKYGFFHLVFSLGAMYFAMLFISWDLNSSTKKWSIDVGWASTWVKIINEWFAATIYMWKLISPVVRQAKIMDDGAMQPNQRC